MNDWDKKIDEMLNRGGIGFWLFCVLGCAGFYGFLWLTLALGTVYGA